MDRQDITPETPARPLDWDIRSALILIAALFVAQVLFSLIVVVVLSATGGATISSEEDLGTLGVVALATASYLFAGATTLELARHFAARRGWPSLRAAVTLRPSRLWPVAIAATLATALFCDALSLALGKPIVPLQYRPVFADPVAGITFGLFSVIAPPVVEEVVFRGALFSALARPFGQVWGVVLSAVAFALVHQLTYDDWYVVLLTFITGLVLGALRAYSGSLLPSVVAHATNNAYASLEAVLLPLILGRWL